MKLLAFFAFIAAFAFIAVKAKAVPFEPVDEVDCGLGAPLGGADNHADCLLFCSASNDHPNRACLNTLCNCNLFNL